jgi:hypothetical protein
MKHRHRKAWMLVASLSALVGVSATVALPGAGAAPASRTYIVKSVRTEGSVWIAGGGAQMTEGHLSAGNRLFETNIVRRDDGARGVFVGTVVVASPGTVAANTAVGLMNGVYRFRDGQIFVEGYVKFSRPSGTGVIVGGTGRYLGVRGTFSSTEARDVLRLLP